MRAQGIAYGTAFGAGDRVGVIRLNASALEFSVNGKCLGAVATAKPMPAGAVGCVGTCFGAVVATQGCSAWNWTSTRI